MSGATPSAAGGSPRVGIGIPVYNGENFLAAALDSVLAQSFGDYEVVISDNASDDRTPEICLDYAARDPRITYVRNDRNLGAAPNYNRTFTHARGEYFKWLAHDDALAPDFLARCVAALDAEPDAVLCQSLIEYIDDRGKSIGIYDSRLDGSSSPHPSARFAALVLRPHPCMEVFGLVRRRALEGSLLHATFHGADRALLAQLALRGRFLRIRQALVQIREHPGRYSRATVRPADRAVWHDAGHMTRGGIPTARLYRSYLRMVQAEVQDPAERWRCYLHLARWWARNWNAARVAVDVTALLAPGLLARAQRLKQRLQPEPGVAMAEKVPVPSGHHDASDRPGP